MPADPGDEGVEAGMGNRVGFKRQHEKVCEGEQKGEFGGLLSPYMYRA